MQLRLQQDRRFRHRAANQRTVAPETVTAQAALVTCGVDDRSATQSVGERSPNSAPVCRAAVLFAGFRTELHHVHPSAQIDRHSLRHSVPEPATCSAARSGQVAQLVEQRTEKTRGLCGPLVLFSGPGTHPPHLMPSAGTDRQTLRGAPHSAKPSDLSQPALRLPPVCWATKRKHS